MEGGNRYRHTEGIINRYRNDGQDPPDLDGTTAYDTEEQHDTGQEYDSEDEYSPAEYEPQEYNPGRAHEPEAAAAAEPPFRRILVRPPESGDQNWYATQPRTALMVSYQPPLVLQPSMFNRGLVGEPEPHQFQDDRLRECVAHQSHSTGSHAAAYNNWAGPSHPVYRPQPPAAIDFAPDGDYAPGTHTHAPPAYRASDIFNVADPVMETAQLGSAGRAQVVYVVRRQNGGCKNRKRRRLCVVL
ncbi:hypothetical protein F4779DRAFT_96091 [Xylariaceae sp. FL0662B]|nr:hypothetical protein F4779DRAFT_96091 [Xylariaceae sp. FL0662B]